MKVRLYSVFDSKTASFNAPRCYLTDAAAIRQFADDVNFSDPKNPWFNHPEDYSLFYVGEYDDETAGLTPTNALNLVTASALKSLDVGSSPKVLN